MTRVDVTVANDLMDGVPQLLELLEAQEISRQPGETETVTVISIDMDYVPAGATTVEAVLQRTDSGVRVHSLAWGYEPKAA